MIIQRLKMHWKSCTVKFAREKNCIWFEGGPELFLVPGPGQPLNEPWSHDKKKVFSFVRNEFCSVILNKSIFEQEWESAKKMILQNQTKLLFTNLTLVSEYKLSKRKRSTLRTYFLRTGAKRQKFSSLVIIIDLIKGALNPNFLYFTKNREKFCL